MSDRTVRILLTAFGVFYGSLAGDLIDNDLNSGGRNEIRQNELQGFADLTSTTTRGCRIGYGRLNRGFHWWLNGRLNRGFHRWLNGRLNRGFHRWLNGRLNRGFHRWLNGRLNRGFYGWAHRRLERRFCDGFRNRNLRRFRESPNKFSNVLKYA